MRYLLSTLLAVTSATLLATGPNTSVLGPASEIRCSDACPRGGPDALLRLLAQYDSNPDPRLLPEIDSAAAQRDAVWSRLYWYTDLDQAKAAAKAQHKPILYLRMLGRLTDEYSCANSRFFRTVLYANTGVSQLLRERFVLAWGSERPVPVVTIDYGDGRVLKRTLTGNSAHYVLDSDGRVVDVLPGLFDPKAFMRIAAAAGEVAAAGSPEQYREHARRATAGLNKAWARDSGSAADSVSATRPVALAQAERAPDAVAAQRRAPSKMAVEAPLVRAASPELAAAMSRSIETADDATWQRVIAAHLPDASLDAQSIALIRSQDPATYAQPGALDRTVQHFQRLIAADSVHNNYQLRRQALAWLESAPQPLALDELNTRVYAELFLTPASDPWLGLKVADTYSALEADGCHTRAAR